MKSDSKCKFGTKNVELCTLSLFIDKPSPGLKNDPLALFLANYCFFSASDHSRNSLNYFFWHQMVHLDFLCVPQSHMVGVSKQGTFIPIPSP